MEKGTEKLFAFIVASAALGIQVEKSLSDDGKISGFKEVFSIGSTAMQQLPIIFSVVPEALEEAKNLSVVETVDIVLKLKEQKVFAGFSNGKIAKWTEAGLDLIQTFLKYADMDTVPLQIGNVYAALQSIQISEKQQIL